MTGKINLRLIFADVGGRKSQITTVTSRLSTSKTVIATKNVREDHSFGHIIPNSRLIEG